MLDRKDETLLTPGAVTGTDEAHPKEARALTLLTRAVSPEATALVSELASTIAATGTYRRGAAKQEKLRIAVEALVCGLLLNASRHGISGWSRQAVNNRAFQGEPVTFRGFDRVRSALRDSGLMQEKSAYAEFFDFGDGNAGACRWLTRLRPTQSLIRLAERHGIALAAAGNHFVRVRGDSRRRQPILLRALSRRDGRKRLQGEALAVPVNDEARAIAQNVAETNAFIAQVEVTGCDPISFSRTCTHDLRHGGRWYAWGDSYQLLKKEQRGQLRIDGEKVKELDVKASHLSILHGLLQMPLPAGDPCGGLGFDREVVKAWITATIGLDRPARRWSSEGTEAALRRGTSLRDIKANEVGAAVLRSLPFFAELPAALGCEHDPRLCSVRLQYVEVEALTSAMGYLRVARSIPALPVHDALIVRATDIAAARHALENGFRAHANIKPQIE